MVIKVKQTKANLRQEFKIYCGGKLQYTGKQWAYSSELFQRNGDIRLTCQYKKEALRKFLMDLPIFLAVLFLWNVFSSIPLTILVLLLFFFLQSPIPRTLKKSTVLDSDNKKAARFYQRLEGLLTGYYVMEWDDREYRMYTLARSHYQYISIYEGDTQVAQINKNLHTVSNRDNYTLYLLDEKAEIADLLTIFILYFDSYQYSHTGELFIGIKKNWKWTYSRTDRFYDETWLPSHLGWDVAENSTYPME